MRRSFASLIAILALTPLAACAASAEDDAPSGVSQTRQFAATGFDRVVLEGPDNVTVQAGKGFSVSATGDSSVLDRLEIEVRNGRLEVGRKRDRSNWGWNSGRRGAAIIVTLPALAGVSLSGSGDMTVDRAQAPAFGASLAGSGDMKIGAVETQKLDLSLAGSGDIQLGGRAQSADISIAGSGDIDAGGLRAESAEISIAGSGNVRAGVSRAAGISLVGSGDVDILGNPTCKISKLGSGEVRCTGAE